MVLILLYYFIEAGVCNFFTICKDIEMSDPTPPFCLHAVDLSTEEHTELTAALPCGSQLKSLQGRSEQTDPPAPSPEGAWLTIFPWRAWRGYSQGRLDWAGHHSRHRVLLLDDTDDIDGGSLEDLMEQGFLAVLRRPLTQERLERVVVQALEVDDLHQDICRMAREIELERELFARKNQQLEFLNKILTRAVESLEVETILDRLKEDLSGLLNVSGTAAVFWQQCSKTTTAEVFFPGTPRSEVQTDWITYLLDTARRLSGGAVDSYRTNALTCGLADAGQKLRPEENLLFPLGSERAPYGALVIVTDEAFKLGQDRLAVIRSAVNHIALALRNGLHFQAVRRQADHDGLTLLHNRQHFDKRIMEELKRHQRHHQPLSLLMLDLDRFKSINDTHGHLAGDMVLHELGRLLLETLRETDFPARYGGEEFVIILPHTNQQQAKVLAERIRKRLAGKRFRHQDRTFTVTGSIGIATIRPASLHGPTELIGQADRALYLAKARGRNMVCVSSAEGTPPGEVCSLTASSSHP